ncbi:radical SAM protein, partial [Xanthobacter autotrophicus]|nr:radical SAM protein [Xanthobacter autotrophicus]
MSLERDSLFDPAGPAARTAGQATPRPRPAGPKAKAAPLAVSEPRANRILGRLAEEKTAPPPVVS